MAVTPSTPVIAPPSPDAPLGAYRADLQALAHLPGIITFLDEADAAIARLRPSPDNREG